MSLVKPFNGAVKSACDETGCKMRVMAGVLLNLGRLDRGVKRGA